MFGHREAIGAYWLGLPIVQEEVSARWRIKRVSSPGRDSNRALWPDRGAEIHIGPNRIGQAIGNTVDMRAFLEG